MKKFIAILGVALLSFTGSVNAQKFGHVDTKIAFEAVPGYLIAKKNLEDYEKKKMADIDDAIKNYQLDIKRFQEQSATWSEDKVAMEKEKLANTESAVLKFREVSQERIRKKQEELLEPMQKMLMDAIKIVAKNSGYAYIMQKEVFLHIEGGNDVTALVVAELKKMKPALPGTKPAPAPAPGK